MPAPGSVDEETPDVKKPRSRRRLFVYLTLVIVAAASWFVWANRAEVLSLLREDAPPPEAVQGSHQIALEISLKQPQGLGPAEDFTGEGVVDLTSGAARVTYDFAGLTNAGGFFGHLEDFDVVYVDDHVDVEIFPRGRPWIELDPSDAVVQDIARLREVILASPLAIPSYLDALQRAGADASITETIVVEQLDVSDPAIRELVSAFEALGISSVEASAASASDLVEVDYAFGFLVPGSEKDTIDISISAELNSVPDAAVELPEPSEYRELGS